MSTAEQIPARIGATCEVPIPRIAIRFCTQCKWNLRAAYYAQELLQTFSTTVGEISLIPTTGGVFDITIYHTAKDVREERKATDGGRTCDQEVGNPPMRENSQIQTVLVWERKRDGGFPEVKELKSRVRNVIDPQKDMGHIDRSLKKAAAEQREDLSEGPPKEATLHAQTSQPEAPGGENSSVGDKIETQSKSPKKRTTSANQNGIPLSTNDQECADCT